MPANVRSVIVQHYADGSVRYCGSRCHNATSKACRCICNGRMHGAALRQLKLPLETTHLEAASDGTGRLVWVSNDPQRKEAS